MGMKNDHSSPHDPPRWAVSFLSWFCPGHLHEGIMGDLVERFEDDLGLYTRGRARRRFAWSVVRLLHPSLLLRHKRLWGLQTGLLRNHLKVASRGMIRNRFYTGVNILGLAFAIAFIFLVYIFIDSERSYDQFHTHADQIYRVYHRVKMVESGEMRSESAVTALPLAKDMHEALPSVTDYTRVGSSTVTIQVDDEPFQESVHFVDPGFLRMFDFPWLAGDQASALDQPNAIILAAEQAKKHFGTVDPLGKVITVNFNDSLVDFRISGIIDPLKSQSSLPFDFLIPFDKYRILMGDEFFTSYRFSAVENYIQTDGRIAQAELNELLTTAVQKFSPPADRRTKLGTQVLSRMHFAHTIVGNAQYTDPKKMYIMLALALLVLVIAVINFVTLSLSHALNRLPEVGIRKTMGALHGQLRRQLILESFILTFAAALLAVGLSYFFFPLFQDLIGSTISFSPGPDEVVLVFLLLISIAWINGWLQSLFLLKNRPVAALKESKMTPGNNRLFNEGLVLVQFALSIMLVIGAVHIRAQMKYVQQRDLGFDQEQLIEIGMGNSPDPVRAQQAFHRFRELALQDARIVEVSAGMNNSREPWTQLIFEQEDGSQKAVYFNQVDRRYLETMGIELLQGTDFFQQDNGSSTGILVNQALVKYLDWTEPLEGQIPGKNFSSSHQVLGVFRDFHFSSLHQRIEPLVLALDVAPLESGITGLSTYVWPANLYQMIVRVGPGDVDGTLAHLESVWNAVHPDGPFTYHFVDEVIDQKYAEERRWGLVMDWASLFALVIAWLGLVGLMRLSVVRKMREIGIRKVLGSSTAGLMSWLSKRFVGLVLLGGLVACPIIWILLSRWLESFSYRISLNPLVFALVLGVILLVAMVSLGLQTYRAATANPAEVLRVRGD